MTELDELIARLNLHMPPATRILDGRVIDANVSERWADMSFVMKPEFCHSMGLQGGDVAAMLDNAMARAVFLVSNETLSPPTLELKVSYLAPGGAGGYRARGRIEHMGRSIAFLSSSVWDASQTQIAKATATAKLVPYRDLGRL
jgi:uncharacterized protein (TIGR00369 family)